MGKSNLNQKVKINIGDWSKDGHSMCDAYIIHINTTVTEMQDAYKASCKKIGVSFNHNDNFTGRTDGGHRPSYIICAEYGDNNISEEAIEILRKYGCPLDDFANDDGDLAFYDYEYGNFIDLLMWFIKQSLPKFEYEIQKNDGIPNFNGYWDSNLNVQIGYGLFDV